MLSCSPSEVWCCLEGGLVVFRNDRKISGALFLALLKPYSHEERSFPPCMLPCVLIKMSHLVCLLKTVGSMAEISVVYFRLGTYCKAFRIGCSRESALTMLMVTYVVCVCSFHMDVFTQVRRGMLSYGTKYAEEVLRVYECTF